MNWHSASAPKHRIRLLIVEDSLVSAELIRRMVATAPEIEVVGTAANGVEALEMIPRVRPDVICTDFHMPKMDGLQLTREVMLRHPLPILVLSVSVQPAQSQNIFRMLAAGALDIMAKPPAGLEFDSAAGELTRKIRVLSGIKVFKRPPAAAESVSPERPPPLQSAGAPPCIIGIGASTGGPQALDTILGRLPADFPLPLVCVQHIAEGFMQGLVDWLASRCRIAVRTAEEGAEPRAGVAYFPPNDRHIEIDAAGRFRCMSGPPIAGHRPSVDIALSSLAGRYRDKAAGVLLTGMGQDGALGMLDIERAGGVTIAQDERSCVVYGMPKCAIELGAARRVLPLEEIGPALIELASSKGDHAYGREIH